jgi:hypothetical protein
MSFMPVSCLADSRPALLAADSTGCAHIMAVDSLYTGALQPLITTGRHLGITRPVFCRSGGGGLIVSGSLSTGNIRVLDLTDCLDGSGTAAVSATAAAAAASDGVVDGVLLCNQLSGGHAQGTEITALQWASDEIGLVSGDSSGEVVVWRSRSLGN